VPAARLTPLGQQTLGPPS